MKNKASLTAIFFTVFIDLMGFGILIPLLPAFASKELGITEVGIGAIVAVFSFMQFLFNPALGSISDRIGRRPVILITQLMTVASYIIFSFSTSFWILLLSRIIGGLGGSNIGVAQAYIADITSKEDRAKGMGLIGAAFGLGFVFGPLIGAFLSKYGYAAAGFGSASFSFIAFIYTAVVLPESLNERKKEKSRIKIFDIKYVKEVIAHPLVGILVFLYFIIIFSIANIYGTFAILGYKFYHFSDQQNGMLFGISGIFSSVVQAFFLKRLSNKFSDKALMLGASFLLMIGLAMFPYGINFLGVAIVMSVYTIGAAILQPLLPTMISKHSPQNQQGSFLGVSQSFSAFGRVLGPLWGGFSYNYLGYQFPFLTGSFLTMVTIVLAYFLLKKESFKMS
jgi:MFS transporter, DHA1 family, tetracycline resistance protein